MAKLADAEVRQKNILRSLRARAPRARAARPPRPSPTQPRSPVSRALSPPPAKAHASYDPKTRVVKQLQSTVDNLLREQASHARLESTSRETFAHLAAEIERVRSAVATLADAVIEEMDAVRADHAAWRSEKEAWTSRMERVEATVEAKSAMIDAWGEARFGRNRRRRRALRDGMRAATEAAAEARAALAAAEQREADIAERLRALRETAEGADAKLQEQIDAVRATAERAAAGPGDGSNAAVPIRDILLAGAASEADVVALRDWTKHVTEAHDGRLRRIERGLHLGGSAAGGGASSGGGGNRRPRVNRGRNDRPRGACERARAFSRVRPTGVIFVRIVSRARSRSPSSPVITSLGSPNPSPEEFGMAPARHRLAL